MKLAQLLTMPAHTWQFWTSNGLTAGDSWGELVTDWSKVHIGRPVVLFGHDLPTIAGRVESKMEDGSALWVRDETWSRRLIHRTDGYVLRPVFLWPTGPKR